VDGIEMGIENEHYSRELIFEYNLFKEADKEAFGEYKV
jgi:hypothetical protein